MTHLRLVREEQRRRGVDRYTMTGCAVLVAFFLFCVCAAIGAWEILQWCL